MTAQILDGKALSKSLRSDLAAEIAGLSYAPGLAVILVGDNPASEVYVKNKMKACAKVGIESFEHRLPADTTQSAVIALISELNKQSEVDGILLQLPLPDHIDPRAALEAIDPRKDADGLHSQNMGRLITQRPGLIPCTPQGCMHLIKSAGEVLGGKHAVMVGCSHLVGRPLGLLLITEDCTVTYAHKKTVALAEHTRHADILAVAAGVPGLITADMVKPGATVIDVGINRLEDGTITGDVAFDEVSDVAGYISPVPGGVGPMTITCLLSNTLAAAKGLRAQ
mgnify:CR=1 FL=1